MKSRINLFGLIGICLAALFFTGIDGYNTEDDAPEGMVLIPAGEFDIGSNDAEARNNEQPVRRVYVDAFYMDETEVTNVQFKEFLRENPRWQKDRIADRFHNGDYLAHWKGNNYPDGKANHPVTRVSWYAAMAYAEWADKRLPTEAEWEKAARGGLVQKKYPWGDTYDLNMVAHGVSNTHVVGKYSPNDYGLYDMAGNVDEWCLDEYIEDFYLNSPERNPLAGDSTLEMLLKRFRDSDRWSFRVIRGGSWFEGEGGSTKSKRCAERIRAASAYAGAYEDKGGFGGFRCVRPAH